MQDRQSTAGAHQKSGITRNRSRFRNDAFGSIARRETPADSVYCDGAQPDAVAAAAARALEASLRHRVSARMRGFLGSLLSLSRPAKRALMISGDLIMIPLALWSALTLRLGSVE